MANVGDVLLPVLGGIAGMSPYLGPGLRSALTVSEAMARKKWRDQEEQRRQEQTEAEAAEQAREAELRTANIANLKRQIESRDDIPAGKRMALASLAEDDPEKAKLELFKYDPPAPEPRRYNPGEVGSLIDEFRGEGVAGQVTLPGEWGGTGNFHWSVDKPEGPTAADAWKPDYKQSATKPWLSYWTDEQGRPQYTVNEAMRAAMDSGAGETAVDVSELEEAEIELQEARSELQEYEQQKIQEARDLSQDNPDAGRLRARMELENDERYKLLQKRVDIADRRYQRLVNQAATAPPPLPTEETPQQSQSAAAANVPTLYFDSQGNPL